MLSALLAAGGPVVHGPVVHGPVVHGSVQACTNYGVHAIEQHILVTWRPAACEGLSKADVNLAVGKAIHAVAGGLPKAAERRKATQAGRWLAYLVSPPPHTSSPEPPGYGRPGSSAPARPGRNAALGWAALGAWILAAVSGSYILSRWIAHGGMRRPRTGGAGLPPVVIFGHFTLAAAGLLVWIIYLVTGLAAVAWTAVGLLLPVAGLGMAMVTIGLPVAAAGPRPAQEAPGRGRMSILVALGHGLLAAGTILLVLLAALSASGS